MGFWHPYGPTPVILRGMPWYSITSLDIAGLAVKREVLYRDDIRKVWAFLSGRIERGRVPDEVFGYWIGETTTDETWDWDIDEPRYRGVHAQEVPLNFGEKP
jgi:hypothetical protein